MVGVNFANTYCAIFIIFTCIFAPSYLYVVIYFALFLFCLLRERIYFNDSSRRLIKIFLLMNALGAIFVSNNEISNAGRDIWYALKVCVCFWLGYAIGFSGINWKKFSKLFVSGATFVSLVQLLKVYFSGQELEFNGDANIGSVSIICGVAVFLILCRKSSLFGFGDRFLNAVCFLIISFAFIFSYSRTGIGCYLIFLLSALGFFEKKKWIAIGLIILFVLFFLLEAILPDIDVQNLNFASKIKNSIVEIAFNDGEDPTQMLLNWRGFESYRAFLGFVNADIFKMMLGQGLGATVDLGMLVDMGKDMQYQFLPVLHNLYLQVLTKFGFFGLILYLFFVLEIFKNSKKIGSLSFYGADKLLVSFGVIILYTSLVITGIYNITHLDPVIIFMGIIYGIAGYVQKMDRMH